MNIEIKINDGFEVEALVNGHVIKSDQSKDSGGNQTAPNPFEYFLASTGLCVAHYVNVFCKQREINTKKISITESVTKDADGKIKFSFNIKTPTSFPEKYKEALIKTASACAVKKAIQGNPIFEVNVE